MIEIRVKEATVLLENDFPNKQLASSSHTHKLSELLGVAGLKQELSKQENYDENFKLNWAVAKDWSETTRYDPVIEETKVKDFFEAITNDPSGVLEWLKNLW